MSRARSLAVLFIAFLSCTTVSAREDADSKRIEIPLKEVYAFGMPGTRKVEELPSAREDSQIIQAIRHALKPKLDANEAQRGFAVSGIGDNALRQVRDVLSEAKKPQARFSAGEPISAVFFSYQSPFYVHLDKVERQGFAFRISYRLVPHQSNETTDHFALIPLGELPPGRYSVRVEQSPTEKKYVDAGLAPPSSAGRQLVCGTFHFVVAR